MTPSSNPKQRHPEADPPTAEAIVAKYDAKQVVEHPFFCALRARPVDLSAIWLLMANLQVGISGHFVHWLAATIARIEDVRIASLIAKQLNDELGNGDFREIHSALLTEFMAGLAPYRAGFVSDDVLKPGRHMRDAMTALFAHRDAYEGVGALIVSELFANKMDRCVGDEIRRQHAISKHSLRWLEVHETLESDHAGDSVLLAELVPKNGPHLAATWRGASTEDDILWRLLDEVHACAALGAVP